MISFKMQMMSILNYLPGAIILVVSLFALYESIVVVDQNEVLQGLYEASMPLDASNLPIISATKNSILIKGKWLYWSVWVLGLSGFVLVLMNADKLRRLSKLNAEKEQSLLVLGEQLEEIKKAEKEKTALRDQLHQAQKLEAVGRLAGGIAHDFNNILAAMNGYAEFLIDDLDKKSPQHGFAKNILKAGRQARELIDKVLAFSRRDRDEILKMHLKDPIDETLSMLKASLPKTVEVKTDIHESDHIIFGNQNLISQALMNLCVNAKDAMQDEKGTLTIALSVADLSLFDDLKKQENLPAPDAIPLIDIKAIDNKHTRLTMGALATDMDYMCLSVSDDGSGMGRIVMEHMFEPFFTTKSVDKGTGLGLAMVHGLVASHSGAMVIESVLGQGTRFDLLFPSLGQQDKITAPSLLEENHKAVGCILLVEDQDDVRQMMETMLSRFGFEVETCEDGVAALEILSEHPDYFNAVLTDQNMPKMTGMELVKQVSEKHPDIPFVMITGYSIESMNGFKNDHPSVRAILKKPVDREKLLEAVQLAVLDRQFGA